MNDQAVEQGSSSASLDADDPRDAEELLTILVVEDDPSVAEVLTTALGARGHTVIVTRTGEAALRAVSGSEPDIVLLDLGLPDMDGVDVCRSIREHSGVPLIVLTADGDEHRKVQTLDLGADDYVTKPFSMPELMARIRVARRNRTSSHERDGLLAAGDVTIDVDARTVQVGDERVHLTQKEYRLAILLVERTDRVLTHETIMADLWPTGGGTTESLRVHVTNLRRKLGPAAKLEIATETGIGYRLVPTA